MADFVHDQQGQIGRNNITTRRGGDDWSCGHDLALYPYERLRLVMADGPDVARSCPSRREQEETDGNKREE
ncbi:MAG: hypothetical protein R3F56_00485 [Planctomycetota bacterium]